MAWRKKSKGYVGKCSLCGRPIGSNNCCFFNASGEQGERLMCGVCGPVRDVPSRGVSGSNYDPAADGERAARQDNYAAHEAVSLVGAVNALLDKAQHDVDRDWTSFAVRELIKAVRLLNKPG